MQERLLYTSVPVTLHLRTRPTFSQGLFWTRRTRLHTDVDNCIYVQFLFAFFFLVAFFIVVKHTRHRICHFGLFLGCISMALSALMLPCVCISSISVASCGCKVFYDVDASSFLLYFHRFVFDGFQVFLFFSAPETTFMPRK